MEFSFTPTYEDLLAGQLLLNGKMLKRSLPWAILVGLLVISTTILDDGFSDPAILVYDLTPYALIFLLAWFIARKVLVPRSTRKTLRLQKNLSAPIHVRWTNDCVSLVAKNGSSNTPLAEYACWLCDEKIVLLFMSQSMFQFFPRRAFPDDDAWRSFKGAVAAAGIPNRWPPK